MQSGIRKPGLKGWLLQWFGLTHKITIKLYHGYGHPERMVIYGHVFSLSPLPRTKYSQNVLTNAFALLRLFFVRPYAGAQLYMEWAGRQYTTKSDRDGFFKFQWKEDLPEQVGWHTVVVTMKDSQGRIITADEGVIYIPHKTQYGFISDIDDTFLISHSANLRKRLFVLLTENARSRQPFDGSVKHYQLLAKGNTSPDAPNPFFYVSSSEWNLYDYILEFTTTNGIPRGVFLLNVLKPWTQLLKTGQHNHHTKFMRIVRILNAYPSQKFTLLGDSSQQDPYIYEAIVRHFPGRIYAVYIRDVYAKNQQKARDVLSNIEQAGVHCCFFTHSEQAILHSQKIGLITEPGAEEQAPPPTTLNELNSK